MVFEEKSKQLEIERHPDGIDRHIYLDTERSFKVSTIKNVYHMLKPGCVYAINIADFNVGGNGMVAYVDEWIRLSTEEGMPLYDTVYLGVTARAGSKQQAAGEQKKENILVFKKSF